MYLVTGGAGFIGSNIVEALVRKGERVRVLDNFSTGDPANLAAVKDRVEIIEGDLRDMDAVRRAVRRRATTSPTRRRCARCRARSTIR